MIGGESTMGQILRARRAKVVLFGMECVFTEPVLNSLASSPIVELSAIVLPGRASACTGATPDPLRTAARTKGIRLIEVADRSQLVDRALTAALEAITPDIIAVACFPWRLPAPILSLPRYGCLNIHPSLLPDGRGPEPVFWAFRWGLQETGVTLHVMDASMDGGPILAQRKVSIPLGASMIEMELLLARLGAELLLVHIETNRRTPLSPCPQQGNGTYARTPGAEDLVVPTSWSAERAAKFIRGVAPIYGAIPVLVLSTGQRVAVDHAVGVEDDTTAPEAIDIGHEMTRIRFASGTLVCRLATVRQSLHLRYRGQ